MKTKLLLAAAVAALSLGAGVAAKADTTAVNPTVTETPALEQAKVSFHFGVYGYPYGYYRPYYRPYYGYPYYGPRCYWSYGYRYCY